jgi:chemotaxis protein methyltransferase CheR
MVKLSNAEFQKMQQYIRTRYGLNLEKKKYLIESKLWVELCHYNSGSFTEYWDDLQKDSTGIMERRMMDLLTTSYTFFCRETQHFDFLRQSVVPAIPRNREKPLRLWSAGCATGQECYTLAMELSDCRAMGTLPVPFSILGTDLSAEAVEAAQAGVYGGSDFARLPHSWQTLYCEEWEDGQFRVKEPLRAVTSFQRQNLMDLPYMAPTYDLIFCRNVLIYFQEAERARLVKKMTDALLPGGYLMIGHTESLLSVPNQLQYIKPAVYRKPEERV